MKHFIRSVFGLRSDISISFYALDFFFRKIFRQNVGVKWAVHHTATLRFPERINVGRDTFPGDSPGVYINARNEVHVGDFTNIGPNVSIVSANHDFIDNTLHAAGKPVVLGKYCWIGASAQILPQVELGDFTIVGAGAVVTKSFPDGFCVIAGNPAKVIKYLDKQKCQQFAATKGQ